MSMPKADLLGRLGLGTASFGLSYGLPGRARQLSPREVKESLEIARKYRLNVIDTAAAYGDSERVLGDILQDSDDFDIVSKLPSGAKNVGFELDSSLERLRRNSLYGYLLHSFADFERNSNIISDLIEAKAKGKVKKFGFSLYFPAQLDVLLQENIAFDLIQVPYSVFDRRFESSFEKVKARGIEIHARSVFLQGAVFLSPQDLPRSLEPLRGKIQNLRDMAAELNVSSAAIALALPLFNLYVDRVILGLGSPRELLESIEAVGETSSLPRGNIDFDSLRENDENVVVPTNWEK